MRVFDALVIAMSKRELIGNVEDDVIFGLHGVDNNHFMLSVPGEKVIFEAVEDPDDGYRSCLECVKISDLPDKLIFFDQPITFVKFRISGDSSIDGFEFYDKDGWIWLRVGTDHQDAYYPVFTFEYSPQPEWFKGYDKWE